VCLSVYAEPNPPLRFAGNEINTVDISISGAATLSAPLWESLSKEACSSLAQIFDRAGPLVAGQIVVMCHRRRCDRYPAMCIHPFQEPHACEGAPAATGFQNAPSARPLVASTMLRWVRPSGVGIWILCPTYSHCKERRSLLYESVQVPRHHVTTDEPRWWIQHDSRPGANGRGAASLLLSDAHRSDKGRYTMPCISRNGMFRIVAYPSTFRPERA
jgi:hypothetical protein